MEKVCFLLNIDFLVNALNEVATVHLIFQLLNIYLRHQQERGLMQKARHLMDQNNVSFQMFLILLSSITLGSESQISVFKEGQSNT